MSNLTYDKYLNKISNEFNNYWLIIQSTIGIPTNVLSIIIFARLMRHKTNMGYLYVWQCLIDLSILLCYLLLFQTTFGVNLITTSDWWCKFLSYFKRFMHQNSSWMAVFITFDRFIFVLYGNTERFGFMKKKLYLTIFIVSIITMIMFVNILNLFFYLNGSCTASYAITVASDFITICFRTYIPFTLMIIFNVVMIRKTFNQSKTTLKRNSTSRKEYQFTIAVIAYDAFFFVCYFPRSIYFILNDANLFSGAFTGNPVLSASYTLFNSTTSGIATLVQTFSFVTYLAFNKLYRREALLLIAKLLPIPSLVRIHPDLTPTTKRSNQQQLSLNNNTAPLEILSY